MFEFVEMYKYNKIAQNLTSKQLYLSRKLDSIAQGLNEKHLKRNSLKIGKYFLYKEKPIKILSGYFLDPTYHRLSNYWTWRRVLSNGSLGIMGSGYGANDEVFKPVTKQEAIRLAKELRRK